MACKHNSGNIQQFTEICLDCGVNIYETPAQRVVRLQKRVSDLRRTALIAKGDALEAEIEALEAAENKDDEQNNGGW
jgi:hypothetical protein